MHMCTIGGSSFKFPLNFISKVYIVELVIYGFDEPKKYTEDYRNKNKSCDQKVNLDFGLELL